MVYGETDKYTIYVKDPTLGELNFTEYLLSFNIEKRINQIISASIKMFAIDTTEKNYIKKGNTLKIFYSSTLIFKGVLDKVTVDYGYNASIEAYGMEVKMQKKITGQSDFRYSTATPTSTIVTDLASTTGLTVGTNDNYGSIKIKFESENRLKALDKLAKSCINGSTNLVYNWYSSYGSDPYDTDYINFNDYQGSLTSTYTFDYGGASSNLNSLSKKEDKTNLVNDVTVLGFGDGTRQLISTTEDADSIAAYGRQEKVFNEPTVNAQEQLDRLANSYLKKLKDPITTIYIEPTDPKLALASISLGDKITLNSDSSGTVTGLPSDFRVAGMIIGTDDYGIEYLTLELSNQEIAFLDSISLSSDVTFESEQNVSLNELTESTDETLNYLSTDASLNYLSTVGSSNYASTAVSENAAGYLHAVTGGGGTHSSNLQAATKGSSDADDGTGRTSDIWDVNITTSWTLVSGLSSIACSDFSGWVQFMIKMDVATEQNFQWDIYRYTVGANTQLIVDSGFVPTAGFSGVWSVFKRYMVFIGSANDNWAYSLRIRTQSGTVNTTGIFSFFQLRKHTHNVPATSVDGLVATSTISQSTNTNVYSLNLGSRAYSENAISRASSENTGNRTSSENVDTRVKTATG